VSHAACSGYGRPADTSSDQSTIIASTVTILNSLIRTMLNIGDEIYVSVHVDAILPHNSMALT